MAVSPACTTLYRTLRWIVILAGFGLILGQVVPAQFAARQAAPKGPRALGLLQLASNGKAHLIPITILYDGQFYDAGAYKAAPVPMALESGTVYEAVHTGVSAGLFTVSGALEANHTWIGDGTWQSASTLAAAAAAKEKQATSKPPAEPQEGPPVLRRAGPEKPKPPEPAQSAPPATPHPAPSASTTASSAHSVPVVEEDPDRPMLRRGAPPPGERKKPTASPAMPATGDVPAPATPGSAVSGAMQLIPAISDSDGPDPRPYAYSLKPEEEQKLRKKILELAADEVRARANQFAAESIGSAAATRTSSKLGTGAKSPQPIFEVVQLRVFDLSNSNEPVVVLTTKARMPVRPKIGGPDLQYLLVLVARDDVYGELHKAFASITDTQHLDVLPRLELIDAVDADGDGRGELLFRQISDMGSGFVVYRVIGDRLWPLFQGTPGL
jgi:hypothetical protein